MEMSVSLLLMSLLSFALLFHVGTSLNYLRNRKHISGIPASTEDTNYSNNNTVSDLTVCIPCRNEENNLRKTLTSLVNQSNKNISVLVLDDQSTDGTQQTLK